MKKETNPGMVHHTVHHLPTPFTYSPPFLHPVTNHPIAHPSQHDVHDHHDPESALPLLPTPKETESVSWTELPNKSQLLILSLCHFSDSLSNLFLLPYLFHLVRSAVSPSNTPSLAAGNDDIVTYYTSIPTTALVSTYSGILVACFPLAQLLASSFP